MTAIPRSAPSASLFPPVRAGLRPPGGREHPAGRALTALLLAVLLAALWVGLAAGPLAAQQATPAAAGHDADAGEGTGPIVLVPAEPKAKPLRVSALAVEARVLGLRAETQLTMTFYNPAPRSIAGDLYLPLPEGATVSGYALDVAGSLVDGVVVDKRHGREAFETEMRKGVDPGLVEWARGHTFKTRVFPIPAHGSRTVRVRYVSPLEQRGQGRGRELTYRLPLRVEGRVDTATVRVEVVRPGRAPQVRAGGLPGLDFGRWRDGWVADTSLQDATLQGDLVIALPENPLANPGQPSVRVEVAPDGQAYFVIDDQPPPAHVNAPLPPRAIALYWDASASRRTPDAQRAVALLRAYFDSRADVPARVTLVVFRDVPEAARTFDLPGPNGQGGSGAGDGLEALLAACAQAVRDGATRLDALPAPPPGSDAVFLVSDGLATLGRGAFPHTAVPVYAFGGGAGGDHAALRALARHSGGAYFNLARLDDAAVLDGLAGPRYRFLGAEFDTGTVTDGYPGQGAPVGARFAYAARLTGQAARVTLLYGVGGTVLHHRTVAVSRAEAARGDLLRVTWAQAKLAELLLEPERYASAITALGRTQSLVTPGTSLIVLERPEQYAAYSIEPPASRPAWRARYAELIARREREVQAKQADKLAYLRKLWRERVAWWNTRFEYPPDFHYEPPPREKPRPSGGLFERLQEQADVARREAPPPGEGPPLARQAAPERERKAKGYAPGRGEATVVVRAWDPDTPYLAELKAAKPAAAYATYLSQREVHGAAPAFYLDVGDFFAARGEDALAERIWSNLAEMELENPALLRVLAHRLGQAERLQPARLVFEEVLRLRPEEPQSHRDLALVLARLGHYRRAVALLGAVVMGNWDARFPEVELIALEELNRIWPQARAAGVDELPIHPSLVALLDVDLRVVLTWDADQADMDLWVTEPSGEQAYYRHRKTTIGGLVSHDLTGGYGPEEYLVHRAMPGTYAVAVKYYANRAPSLAGSVTLQVEIFTHYGRENEERRAVTVRLRKSKEMLQVAEVSF